jgi:catechol 2,3-dioxygenase-like lactoylglutathione lyase family enzyme
MKRPFVQTIHLSIGTAVLMLSASAIAQPAPVTAPAPAAVAVLRKDRVLGPGIYVSDPQRSLRFYRDGLGMKVRMQFGPAERPDTIVGFGDDTTEPSVMLLSDRAGAERRKIEHAHGFDRFVVFVTDIEGVSRRLRELGFAPGDIRLVHGTSLMMMATDPDGYRVEIIGNKPG